MSQNEFSCFSPEDELSAACVQHAIVRALAEAAEREDWLRHCVTVEEATE